MHRRLLPCGLLLGTAAAFQLPSSLPARRASSVRIPDGKHAHQFQESAISATALHGKLWKRLQIEEDDPAMGTSWYLINCVAGVELDLLNQCRYVCEEKGFPTTDVEKFVVPTERHLRSHGDKKKVVDVKVRYPGYVFCKMRLVEDVYEVLQELELCRSWMGTVNRKGHKKLPPAPLPLSDEEVAKFKGLEEAQEVFEDMFAGDYTGRNDTGADLLAQYAGYDVGQMVKVLRGNFEGEDGTVRRLKDGQLMVRMFTYGQTYDEWFDPDAIRPMTDLEVMRGMSGPTQPINQDQFDVSIGKKDPSILEDTSGMDERSMRSGLMQSAGAAPGRNRREDRVARGETGRDMFGRNAADVKKEEENWLAYREEQRAGGRGGRGDEANSVPAHVVAQTEAKKSKAAGPKKGQDTWGIVERSSWDGGEYGFEADSEQEERELMSRTAEIYKDRPQRGRRGRNDRDAPSDRRQGTRGGFDDRRNERERRPVRQSRGRDEDDWSRDEDSAAKEDDFFDSLMSELSDDLSEDGGARSRGARHHDSAGPNAKRTVQNSGQAEQEDSFFANLMSELSLESDSPSSPSAKAKADRKTDDNDFFANLEAELSQSLEGDSSGRGAKPSDKAKTSSSDDFFDSLISELGEDFTVDDDAEDGESTDDFFASLEQEMGKELDEPPSQEKPDEVSEDDFFSSLFDDVADEVESSDEPKQERHAESSTPASSNGGDLSSLTVPELKDLLRSRGLKVGGKKAELIERLSQ
ncbi:hypothetical protein ACHAXT_010014 [Thalassiosira profunda]